MAAAAIFLCTETKAFADNLAENLTNMASVNASGVNTSQITDDNRGTKIKVTSRTDISFEILEPVHSLYFVWDKPPVGAYITLQSGKTVILGENEFLHELVTLTEGATQFTITLENAVLCDIYFFSSGNLPQFVQKWQPPHTDADILLLPTHADDEHLFFGGTMPLYSASKKVQVAYLNNHWGEAYRPHELLNGLWAVGVTSYPIIPKFNDAFTENLEHALKVYNEDEILAYQTMLIRRFKPEVIIAHDINGEYGHGTHMLNAYGIQKSILLAQDESAYPESAAEFGTFTVLKTYLHLWNENQIVMDWDVQLPHFNGKTALEMAVIGFAEHVSQQKYFKVEATGPYDCRKFGLYNTNVGVDVTKNDFFENITEEMYSDYTPPQPPPEIKEQLPESMSPTPEENNQTEKDKLPTSEFPLWILAMLPIFIGVVIVVLSIRRKKTK